jgi:hypothetical protein
MGRKKEIKKPKRTSVNLDVEDFLRFKLRYKRNWQKKLRELIREELRNGKTILGTS